MLGAIASSTIAVAGTVFSITIAALSLASGQMGPRLLHNFTRDRGNQITLGAFIGTFVYALMVLRTVRSPSEGEFVPHLALTVAILLAFVCVAMLVWFVAHMAERINVDTVIDLVSSDVNAAVDRLAVDAPQQPPPPEEFWRDAAPIIDRRCGYLQQLDADGLADWVFHNHAAMRLLVRPGDYVFPNTPIAVIKPRIDGAGEAILNATALGPQRRGEVDIDYTIAQLIEVAVRALSSGVNDPQTAISVLDRLGAVLCKLSGTQLSNGVTARHDRAVLVVPMIDYAGLVGAMLQMIRQNAAGRPPVLNKLLQVLTAVAGCERDPARSRCCACTPTASSPMRNAASCCRATSMRCAASTPNSWPSPAPAPQLTRSPLKMAIQGQGRHKELMPCSRTLVYVSSFPGPDCSAPPLNTGRSIFSECQR